MDPQEFLDFNSVAMVESGWVTQRLHIQLQSNSMPVVVSRRSSTSRLVKFSRCARFEGGQGGPEFLPANQTTRQLVSWWFFLSPTLFPDFNSPGGIFGVCIETLLDGPNLSFWQIFFWGQNIEQKVEGLLNDSKSANNCFYVVCAVFYKQGKNKPSGHFMHFGHIFLGVSLDSSCGTLSPIFHKALKFQKVQ